VQACTLSLDPSTKKAHPKVLWSRRGRLWLNCMFRPPKPRRSIGRAEVTTFLHGLKTTAELVQFILTFLEEAQIDPFFEKTANVHFAAAKLIFTDAKEARTEADWHREIGAGIGSRTGQPGGGSNS
jgi:hypothetical protein